MANIKEMEIRGSTEDAFWFGGYIGRERTKGSHDPAERQEAIALIASWTMSPLGGISMTYDRASWAAPRFAFSIRGHEAISEAAIAALVNAIYVLGGTVSTVYSYDVENREGGCWTAKQVRDAITSPSAKPKPRTKQPRRVRVAASAEC